MKLINLHRRTYEHGLSCTMSPKTTKRDVYRTLGVVKLAFREEFVPVDRRRRMRGFSLRQLVFFHKCDVIFCSCAETADENRRSPKLGAKMSHSTHIICPEVVTLNKTTPKMDQTDQMVDFRQLFRLKNTSSIRLSGFPFLKNIFSFTNHQKIPLMTSSIRCLSNVLTKNLKSYIHTFIHTSSILQLSRLFLSVLSHSHKTLNKSRVEFAFRAFTQKK